MSKRNTETTAPMAEAKIGHACTRRCVEDGEGIETMYEQQTQDNPYLARVPLDRVRSDALYGVRLARLAWRQRDSEGAARELGKTIEPGHECELTRRPPPAKTGKPARRKARKKTTARAKASANVSHGQPTSARKSKKTTKRRRGPKTTRRTKKGRLVYRKCLCTTYGSQMSQNAGEKTAGDK